MTTPFTLRQDNAGNWIAHAVALDLVAVDKDRSEALKELQFVCIAQVGFAKKHWGQTVNTFFAAPPEYWVPPFLELE